MSSGIPDPKALQEEVGEKGNERADILHKEVLANADLMHDAFDGENYEHEETMWESVKSHPKACFWAFIMCFTIVSLYFLA